MPRESGASYQVNHELPGVLDRPVLSAKTRFALLPGDDSGDYAADLPS
jgi:hypothetical protein